MKQLQEKIYLKKPRAFKTISNLIIRAVLRLVPLRYYIKRLLRLAISQQPKGVSFINKIINQVKGNKK